MAVRVNIRPWLRLRLYCEGNSPVLINPRLVNLSASLPHLLDPAALLDDTPAELPLR